MTNPEVLDGHPRQYTTARAKVINSSSENIAPIITSDFPPFEQRSTNLVDVSFNCRSKKYFKLFPIIRSFVRRRPMAYVGSAIILGLAASQFLKAADRHENKTLQSPDAKLRHSPYNTPHAGTYRTPLWVLQKKTGMR
ncbi:hypothetical protein ACOI1H_19110 [Loktanella sp. DJP18]|uniref:hypothetical protein n=1 Tax=Loktanella sp. DJP18 TaxID=3409788 RepID=UPI003BB707CD